MSEPEISFFTRLVLALNAFWRTLADPAFAAHVTRYQPGAADPTPSPPDSIAKAAILRETTPEAALQLLGLLQQEGRFVDFLQEDVSAYSDAEIGGAARVVHEGCRKTLREHLRIEPVRQETEGVRLTLAEGFDPSAVRLTGNVVGKAPFTGTLVHRGWRVVEIKLPKLTEGHNVDVVAPAEVEL